MKDSLQPIKIIATIEGKKKKDIEKLAELYSEKLIDSGEFNQYELFAFFERLSTFCEINKNIIKEVLPRDNYSAFGMEFTPTNGRLMPQYKEDEVYSDLYDRLKEREDLLKIAMKSKGEIYDSEGVLVPKVSEKYGKDFITVKY